MFTSPKEGGPAAPSTLPPGLPHFEAPLPVLLREHLHRLKLLQNVLSVAVMALHSQNAELDYDVAAVLDHHASQPLDFEIETLEALLNTLAHPRPKGVAA
jgi:hypothetical protein